MDQRLNATHNIGNSAQIVLDRYMAASMGDRSLKVSLHRAWTTDQKFPPEIEATLTHHDHGSATYFVESEQGVMFVQFAHGAFEVTVSASDKTTADAMVDELLKQYPRAVPKPNEPVIYVRFWAMGSDGPYAVTRKLDAPTFKEIEGNYSPAVRAQLAAMVAPSFEPGAGGQLLLWHGPPGTGKTWALRSVARDWAKWCQIDYVVDPDAFFGKASYLLQVLLSGAVDDDEDQPDIPQMIRRGMSPEAAEEHAKKRERWRLLIFEDTGELLSSDARERAGQGLSRLLNTVDGFVGQGLKTLVLLTTNEDIGRLHSAVSRPGRCAVQIPFDSLDPQTSTAWASKNGISVPERSHTLAELFAIAAGRLDKAKPKSIGFDTEAAAISAASKGGNGTK